MKNYSLLLLLTIFFFACTTEEKQDQVMDDYRVYVFTEDELIVNFFELGFPNDVDVIAQLNPDYFMPTDRSEVYLKPSQNIFFFKSTQTGVVYESKVKKGDKIILPRYR